MINKLIHELIEMLNELIVKEDEPTEIYFYEGPLCAMFYLVTGDNVVFGLEDGDTASSCVSIEHLKEFGTFIGYL